MPSTWARLSHRLLTWALERLSSTRMKWEVVMPKSSFSLLVPTMPVRSWGRLSNKV